MSQGRCCTWTQVHTTENGEYRQAHKGTPIAETFSIRRQEGGATKAPGHQPDSQEIHVGTCSESHLNATLDHFGLAGEDREAVVSFVESTKGDIVEA